MGKYCGCQETNPILPPARRLVQVPLWEGGEAKLAHRAVCVAVRVANEVPAVLQKCKSILYPPAPAAGTGKALSLPRPRPPPNPSSQPPPPPFPSPRSCPLLSHTHTAASAGDAAGTYRAGQRGEPGWPGCSSKTSPSDYTSSRTCRPGGGQLTGRARPPPYPSTPYGALPAQPPPPQQPPVQPPILSGWRAPRRLTPPPQMPAPLMRPICNCPDRLKSQWPHLWALRSWAGADGA